MALKPPLEENPFESIIIFCDGACSGNPGRGGWGTIVATPEGQVYELGGGEIHTTNNQMELTGAIEGLASIKGLSGKVRLYTDSVYVIKGITQWIWGWRKKDWKAADGSDVKNRAHWQRLSALVAERGKANPISWHFVRGHSGVPGNERVDEISVAFAKSKHISLYQGPLLRYSVPLHDIPEDTSVPEMKPKAEAKGKPFSYLSVVGTIAMRHSTWAECERRVKGRSGAKFKKALSASDEAAILRSWNIDPSTVQG